jgi:hypothetical protein
MNTYSAIGTISLLSKTGATAGPDVHQLRLEASIDGNALLMTDVDSTEPGVHRKICYRITVAELVLAIQMHGIELTPDSTKEAITTLSGCRIHAQSESE